MKNININLVVGNKVCNSIIKFPINRLSEIIADIARYETNIASIDINFDSKDDVDKTIHYLTFVNDKVPNCWSVRIVSNPE